MNYSSGVIMERHHFLSLRLSTFIVVVLLATTMTCVEVRGASYCHRYDVDGCSIPFGLPFFYKSRFTPSCDRHDICYRCGIAYNIIRKRCDTSFRSDMRNACRKRYLDTPITADHTDSISHLQHKTDVLDALEKHWTTFEGVMMTRFYSSLSSFGQLEPEKFMSKFTEIHMEPTIEQWALLLTELLSDQRSTRDSLTSNVIPHSSKINFTEQLKFQPFPGLSDDPAKSQTVRDFLDILLSPKSSPILWGKIPGLKDNRKLKDVAYFSAQKRSIPSSNDIDPALCGRVLSTLKTKTSEQTSQEPLLCSDLQGLTCFFFAGTYYMAVRLFGGSKYLKNPRIYCSESFVRNCLPS